MNFFIDSIAKVTVIGLAALSATSLLRRQSAALRHFVLAAAVILGAVTPVVSIFTPTWSFPGWASVADTTAVQEVEWNATSVAVTAGVASIPPVNPATNAFVRTVATFVWLAGAVISVAVLLVGALRLALIAGKSQPIRSCKSSDLVAREYGMRRQVRLLRSASHSILATWGFFRPTIVLPHGAVDWTEDRTLVVLSHELAHVRRGDWLIQFIAELLRAVYWFNPFIWMLCRRLRLESEFASDDLAINRGIDGAEYAAHLLELAKDFRTGHRAWSSALAMARPSTIERRFEAMLNPSRNRQPIARRSLIAVSFALFLFAIPIVTFSSSVPQPAPPPAVITTAVQPVSTLPVSTVPVAVAPAPPMKVGKPKGSPRQSGLLQGQVFDPSMAVISGAQVIATAVGTTTYELSTISDERGIYTFPSLPMGTYRVAFRTPGFKVLNIDNVDVRQQASTVNAFLVIAAVHEVITVKAPAGATSAQATTPGEYAACVSFATPPPPPPPPFSAGAGQERIRQGGHVELTRLLSQAKPVYPVEARVAQSQGTVVLQVVIGTNGRIIQNKLVSGDPVLAIAARDAIDRWCYRPTFLNGVAVETVSDVTVNFVLQE